MTSLTTDPTRIRALRAENPKMRERDFARIHGVSEAQLVAAHIGEGVIRLRPDVKTLLENAASLGEVLSLTRNESAVHEKIGVFEKVHVSEKNALVLGENIDLRIFPTRWASGFAVEKQTDDGIKRSLQFFDAAGESIYKIHLREASNLEAYRALVDMLRAEEQSPLVETGSVPNLDINDPEKAVADADTLRDAWKQLTDTHQFFGMLRKLNLRRVQALDMVGEDFAWRVENDSVVQMLNEAARTQVPVMAFVGNAGCIQIHAGPVQKIAPMGPWINVMDENFHMHLRTDHIVKSYVVRKPTSDGHVTSLETYDADDNLIIQFFGKRHEGNDERQTWREIAEALPVSPRSTAA